MRVYVNQQTGNDSNPGSEFLPLLTISAAIASPQNTEIFIEDGIYSEIIDSARFDLVRRKVIGTGDVYINAQGSSSSFSGSLGNEHLFKNIKFVNYRTHGINAKQGKITVISCFFKPLQKAGSSTFLVTPTLPTQISTFIVKKCTIISHENVFKLQTGSPARCMVLDYMENTLIWDNQIHIKQGAYLFTFAAYLSANNDKGNYYEGNTHLTNGGIDSNSGESPPLFIDAPGGNYDLQTTSALIGAGFNGSDIGSFHDYSPFTMLEPTSIFDAGWQNDNRYFNALTNSPGPDGPSDACAIIQADIDGAKRWILNLAATPAGKSGRLLSPVIDMKLIRTITRGSWAAIEDTSPASGSKKVINNSNILVRDLEIRGQTGTFLPDDTTPIWTSFDKNTSINLLARFVQVRIVFRLDGV